MIKVSNKEMKIMGNNVVTEAEFTLLLNVFFEKTVALTDHEHAMDAMRTIAEVAISDDFEPTFSGFISIELDHSDMGHMVGSESDVAQALAALAGVMYKTHIDRDGEDKAKEWLAFIGRLAVATKDELSDLAADVFLN